MGEGSFEEAGRNNVLKSMDYGRADNKAIKNYFKIKLAGHSAQMFVYRRK